MPTVDLLKELVSKKKEKILSAKATLPLDILKEKVGSLTSPTRPFLKSISKPNDISLIAEIKKASPSSGVIREDFNPSEISRIYEDSGVQAISVLTEEDYFQGDIAYLQRIRDEVKLPLLRKDFILEDYQVYESRLFGADAILLIAGLLSKEDLSGLLDLANGLGLDCLVEVHNEKELKKALSIKKVAPFGIGINNRDLHTLNVDFHVTEKLFPLVPKEKTIVIESGIKKYEDVLFLKILGVKAVLIGEAFMAAGDIKTKVKEIMGW